MKIQSQFGLWWKLSSKETISFSDYLFQLVEDQSFLSWEFLISFAFQATDLKQTRSEYKELFASPEVYGLA